MKLSIYTFVRNGLYYDYHVVDMLKHHLPFADEIIVNEGYSDDGTYERISRLDPKIRIFRSQWGQAKDFNWFVRFKDEARQRCTGDWCILLDCDEFIPEWEFDRIRRFLRQTDGDTAALRLMNFYGNYRVYHRAPEKAGWPDRKTVLHRNLPEMEVWGDGSNVRHRGSRDSQEEMPAFTCHHFGFVRHAARLREKWKNLQGSMHLGRRKWFNLPSFLFNWLPHDWNDPQFVPDLEVYDGPFIHAVRENPNEFVRDRYALLHRLRREAAGSDGGRSGKMLLPMPRSELASQKARRN